MLGLGNDILSDDAVGLHLARQLRQRLADSDTIEVLETSEMGLALLDYVVGFEELVLIDAIQTGRVAPGYLHEFDVADLRTERLVAPHFLGVGEVLALARQLGLAVPDLVRILAVEVEDPFTVRTQLTSNLQQAMPALVEQVIDKLRERSHPLFVGVDDVNESADVVAASKAGLLLAQFEPGL